MVWCWWFEPLLRELMSSPSPSILLSRICKQVGIFWNIFIGDSRLHNQRCLFVEGFKFFWNLVINLFFVSCNVCSLLLFVRCRSPEQRINRLSRLRSPRWGFGRSWNPFGETRFNKSYYLILPVRTTIDMLICWDISWVGGGRFLLCSVQNIFMAQAEKDLLGAIDIVGIFLSIWSSSSKW